MSYSKEDVKDNLTIDDVYDLLEFFGANPKDYGDYLVAQTICHNESSGSMKLYYYDNNQMFHCYTHCGSFDVIELVQKVKGVDFNAAIYFLVNYFNLQYKLDEADIDYSSLDDWKIFDRTGKIEEIQSEDIKLNRIHLKEYDDSVIAHYPQPRIAPFEDAYISYEVCKEVNIRYDPISGSILIPHYDEDDRCIGIRQRTIIQENEVYGKYRPWYHNKKQYNHALAFALYNLNKSKENIRRAGLAIVVESEKSALAYSSFFGIENSLAVAVCGSSLSRYQFESLQLYGAKEIVIAFDKDYTDTNDERYATFVEKMCRINKKYGSQCNLSFIVDTLGLLGEKESPTDRGKEVFLTLFKNRRYMKSVI